jgi:hypothetical protein
VKARSITLGVVGMTLTLTTLWACSDDSGTSAAPTSDGGTESDTSTGADSSAPAATLPAYIVPGTESMAAITVNKTTGELFVDSAESGKIYRGMAGADHETTMELFADFTSAGITRGGHIALSPDGKTMFMASGFGDQPHVNIIDVATKTLTRTVAMPSTTGGGGPTSLQDVAVSPDGKSVYATNPFENVIHALDIGSLAASTFPISKEFPHISDPSQGFLNASGLTISNDGQYLLVVHLIDKHLYRVSLDPATLGKAQQIDTSPYNVSGNGLWLGADNEAIEVAGDELRVFRFKMNADSTKGGFLAKYQGDFFEQGLTYAVAYQDRVLVLNGNGISLAGGGGGVPNGGGDGGGDAGDAGGGGFPSGGDGGGFPQGGGDAGAKKLPIKVLQLRK